jgi:hypothetical protein
MNEFSQMIKEAFAGEEPYRTDLGRQALEESIRRFERRDRAVRLMSWFAVAFMSAVTIWAVVAFVRAPQDASLKELLVYAAAFLWSMMGVGWMKMFLALMQNDIGIRKELKRVQLLMLEGSE